jgi:RNA polymerase sigma-70 factor (ECF subfamily)
MELANRMFQRAKPVDWEEVFVVGLPRVFNYFRFHGLEDAEAEDLTAATFEKAWYARDAYRPDRAGFSTWLITIAHNTLVDYFRSRRAEVNLEALEERAISPAQNIGLEEAAQKREEAERLRRLLLDLPEREQELLALKYGAGMTNRAIARMTGLSETNIGTILNRAIAALRAQMEAGR